MPWALAVPWLYVVQGVCFLSFAFVRSLATALSVMSVATTAERSTAHLRTALISDIAGADRHLCIARMRIETGDQQPTKRLWTALRARRVLVSTDGDAILCLHVSVLSDSCPFPMRKCGVVKLRKRRAAWPVTGRGWAGCPCWFRPAWTRR